MVQCPFISRNKNKTRRELERGADVKADIPKADYLTCMKKMKEFFPSRLQNAVNRDHTKQLLLMLAIFACWTDVKLDKFFYL